MAQIETANSTAGKVNVGSNADAAYALSVNLPATDTASGFASMVAENDDGTVRGSRYMKALEVSEDYRLRVGMDQSMFNMDFAGTTIAQAHIQQNLTTMTAAQASGFLTLNSGNATASGNAANVRTYRTFPIYGTYPLYVEQWVREGNPTATNAITEWGAGYATGVAAPTDGVFWRRASGGQLLGVICYNSSETTTVITTTNVPSRDGAGSYDETEANHYLIVVHNDECAWWINDTLVLKVAIPATSPVPTSAMTQPMFARVYNSGIASAGRRIELGFINISLGDMNASKPWAQIVSGGGGGAYQTQTGSASGGTVTRTAATNGWPASATAKTSGTWTATSAPASNDLGGRWLSPAISTLTSEADYPVFAYLNPAGTATLPGKTLYITGIRVGECVAMAAASTNAIALFFAAAVGSTAAATSTADAAAAVGPRIIPLGATGFGATAAIGDVRAGFHVDFNGGPLICPPGTYVHFIVRPVGTVTSNTLTVGGSVTFAGYFE